MAQHNGDHAGLCRLEGSSRQRSCRSEGWELEGDPVGLWSVALEGLRSRPEDQRSHGLRSSGSTRDYGAWLGVQYQLFF
jgi:hypothetical protein